MKEKMKRDLVDPGMCAAEWKCDSQPEAGS